MFKEFIATGDSIESAVLVACKELGYGREQVNVDVLEEPVKKTLGLFGGSPAKVRVYVEITTADKAVNYIKDVFSAMGVENLTVEVTDDNDGILIKLDGDNISFIIGHRGDTLDSLQYLVSLVANQGEDTYKRISIDVGTFREKRKDTLESLGKKIALKSLKYGKNQILEPMNPYERRIIHFAVQSVEGAKSWSEGEDLTRHVVVGPVDGERKISKPRYNNDKKPPFDKRNNNRRDNRNGERRYNDRPVKETKETSEFRKKVAKAVIYDDAGTDFKSTPMDSAIDRKKEADAPLYGRIK